MINQIGPYRVLAQIIETNKTVIYRVEYQPGKTAIAKVPLADEPDISELARYERELVLLQKINSPHVAQGYEYVKIGSKAALLLEDCDGSDLLSMIASKKNFSMAEFLKLALGAARGLQAIHGAKMVHLDINPSNLILLSDKETLKIIDFGITKELTDTGIDAQKIEFEGSLPYISPEQTGSMNRMIDHRSDFYSLGVTFYELLAGMLPFQFDDRMSYIHAHIAREAIPLCNVNPSVPPIIGDIVQKLMNKNAEDRYQSAFGLIADLMTCQTMLSEGKDLKSFTLGTKDQADRIDLGHRLYGRSKEQQDLAGLLELAAKGNSPVALVHGFTGMGTTSLVMTLQKLCTEQKHLFAVGAAEQGDQDRPFILLTRALDRIFTSTLAEGRQVVEEMRSEILARIGRAAGLLRMIVPSSELVLGKIEAPNLDPNEKKQVMMIALHDLLQIWAKRAKGMVLFFDNLGHADLSSLEFLQHIILRSQVSGLLLVAGYRTNEIAEGTPHDQALMSIKGRSETRQMELGGLAATDIESLLTDALHARSLDTSAFARTIALKTQGNPRFIGEFLKLLSHSGHLKFDYEKLDWTLDMKQVASIQLSGSLADFIGEKFSALSENAKQTLAKASVIGSEFNLKDLSALLKASSRLIYPVLADAVVSGILSCPSDDYHILATRCEDASYDKRFDLITYRFAHDKLYHLSCSYLAADEREATHLALARRYAATTDKTTSATVAHHYLQAVKLIETDQEKWQVVQLCLNAGLSAKNSAAFKSAYQFLACAEALLTSLKPDDNRSLALQTRLEFMECAFLAEHIPESEATYQWLIKNAHEEEIRYRLYPLRAFHLITLGRLNESLNYGLEAMASLGIKIPLKPSPFALIGRLLQVKKAMKGRAISDIANLPLMTDPRCLTIMRISTFTVTSAMLTGNKILFAYMVLVRMLLSVTYGLAPSTPAALGGYALLMSHKFHKLKEGAEYGKLVQTIIEKHKNHMQVSRGLGPYFIFLAPWDVPYTKMKEVQRQLQHECLQEGDLAYLGIAASYAIYYPDDIRGADIQGIIKKTWETLVLSANPDSFDQFYAFKLYWDRIADDTVKNLGMNHEITPEAFVSAMEQRNFASGLFIYYTLNMKLSYLYGDYAKAKIYRDLAIRYEGGVVAHKSLIDYHCFSYLTLARHYPTARGHERKRLKKEMTASAKFFDRFAQHNPDNFMFLKALVGAAALRTFGAKMEEVQQRYDEAIALAENYNEFWGALANHEAAAWHRDFKREKLARLYCEHALYLYNRLGATALCSHIARLYDIVPQAEAGSTRGTLHRATSRWTVHQGTSHRSTFHSTTIHGTTTGGINLEEIFMTLQGLSDEMEFGPLLTKFAKTLLEHSGAEKLILILKDPESGTLYSVLNCSMATLTAAQILEEPLDTEKLPLHLIQYVERSAQTLILDAASKDSDFVSDPYINSRQVLSILCSPLIRSGQLVGLIYLENAQSKGAFTSKHEQLVKLLAHQTAATIHSLLLQRDLERKVKQKTRDMVTMMQNLKQGIFMIGMDGKVEEGASVYLKKVLETEEITGASAIDLLFKNSTIGADRLGQMGTVVAMVGENRLSYEVNQSILLDEYTRSFGADREKVLQLDWDPITDDSGCIARIMVTVRDVTELRKIQLEAERNRGEMEIMMLLQNHGGPAIRDFLIDFTQLAGKVEGLIMNGKSQPQDSKLDQIFRHVHTQKGIARTLGFKKVADLIHDFEASIEQLRHDEITGEEFGTAYQKFKKATAAALEHLQLTYQRFYSGADAAEEKYAGMLDELETSILKLDNEEKMKTAIKKLIARADSVAFNQVVRGAAAGLATSAALQHKATPELVLEGDELRVPSRHVAVFKGALVHILSNCLDHGLETTELRVQQGKKPAGTIQVVARAEKSAVHITVGDDGAGLNLERIRSRAAELNLINAAKTMGDMEIGELIFAAALSTSAQVTASSGRGVGMDAVRRTLEELQGSIKIVFTGERSQAYRPFKFLIELPLSVMITKSGDELPQERQAA
jgi:predicted ATPase/GAF domain-containing protein/HPt (histidine-containing phosphotransfer) domain-containing protein